MNGVNLTEPFNKLADVTILSGGMKDNYVTIVFKTDDTKKTK